VHTRETQLDNQLQFQVSIDSLTAINVQEVVSTAVTAVAAA
jgi:hypothetical protein